MCRPNSRSVFAVQTVMLTFVLVFVFLIFAALVTFGNYELKKVLQLVTFMFCICFLLFQFFCVERCFFSKNKPSRKKPLRTETDANGCTQNPTEQPKWTGIDRSADHTGLEQTTGSVSTFVPRAYQPFVRRRCL